MNQVLKNNEKTTRILNKLIRDGFYKGVIEVDKFDLKRVHFPCNFRIIGNLKSDNFFEVTYDYQNPMNVLYRIFLISGAIIFIICLMNQNWLFSIISIIIELKTYLSFRVSGKKELELFVDKVLYFSKIE